MEKLNIIMRVVRDTFNPNSTLSINYINRERVGYIVEDTVRKIKIKNETAIPFGTYLLALRFSPKFTDFFYWSEKENKLIEKEEFIKLKVIGDYIPHQLIWITAIPNYEYVLIHWGNSSNDTSGCLIVGEERVGETVINSKINYMKIYPTLYNLIKTGDKFIEITK